MAKIYKFYLIFYKAIHSKWIWIWECWRFMLKWPLRVMSFAGPWYANNMVTFGQGYYTQDFWRLVLCWSIVHSRKLFSRNLNTSKTLAPTSAGQVHHIRGHSRFVLLLLLLCISSVTMHQLSLTSFPTFLLCLPVNAGSFPEVNLLH